MAGIFDNTSTPFTDAPATNKFNYASDLKDEDIVKQTVTVPLRADSIKVGKVSYTSKVVLVCKATTFEDAKDKAKIIDSCTDEQQIVFQIVDSDGAVVSEWATTFAELKTLKAGDHYNNELAIRSAVRFAGSLGVAHAEMVEDGDKIKLTYITGDKKYGARTIVALPKPAIKQVTLVEIANIPRVNPNMG